MRRFDQEKEKARVQQLERLLREERELRKEAEQKVHHLQKKSLIPERMDILDFSCLTDI